MSGDGVSFDVKVEDLITPKLAKLAKRVSNLEPILDEIGASNVTETQHRFEEEKDPEGNDWAPLADGTKDRRIARGRSLDILRDRVDLFDTLSHRASSRDVRIGVNKTYGRIQQLGGMTGRGHATRIVARPYLGMSDEGQREAVEIMTERLEEAVA